VGAIPRQDRWEWIDMVASVASSRPERPALPILLDMGDTGVGLVIGLANQFLRIGLFLAGGRNALERHLPQPEVARAQGRAPGPGMDAPTRSTASWTTSDAPTVCSSRPP
jgi:hypothetical protein